MASPWLNEIPQPLLEELTRGRWLPVIGAGFSKNAVIPHGMNMPTWRELGDALAAENPTYQAASVLDAISAYEAAFDRPRLVNRLAAAVLAGKARPGSTHRAFCEVPFEIVLTTNFDMLLENQYDLLGRACHPVVEETQLAIPNPYDGPLLIKLHGDIHHPDRLVATEDDYDAFLHRNPMMATFVTSLLLTRVAVLIGYSLDDPDFRNLLAVVNDRLGPNRPRPWTITVDADASSVTRFERRGVRVINLDSHGRSRSDVYTELFEELRRHWIKTVPNVVRTADPRIVEATIVPETSALCVFSIPERLARFYVDQVFPAIQGLGLTPVTPSVLAAPEGSGTAATEALFAQAVAVVIDVGDGTGFFDVGLVHALNPEAQVILVTTSTSPLTVSLSDYLQVRRSQDPLDEGEQLATTIAEALASRASLTQALLAGEPRRLLAARAYGPAVVSAFALLEARLRARYGADSVRSTGKPGRALTVQSMLRMLDEEQVIDPGWLGELLAGWQQRNAAVHGGTPPTKARSTQVVELVELVLARLDEYPSGFVT